MEHPNGLWAARPRQHRGHSALDGADAECAGRPAFSDATTVFPDHVSARITAIAALAALVRRDRSGVGAHVHVSQAEAAINQLDTLFVTEAARTAGQVIDDDPGIHAVYPCAGDDEWCVISIRSDEDLAAIGAAMGRASSRRS